MCVDQSCYKHPTSITTPAHGFGEGATWLPKQLAQLDRKYSQPESAQRVGFVPNDIDANLGSANETAEDIRDFYPEAKSQGYDGKTIRVIVRLQEMEKHARLSEIRLEASSPRAMARARDRRGRRDYRSMISSLTLTTGSTEADHDLALQIRALVDSVMIGPTESAPPRIVVLSSCRTS